MGKTQNNNKNTIRATTQHDREMNRWTHKKKRKDRDHRGWRGGGGVGFDSSETDKVQSSRASLKKNLQHVGAEDTKITQAETVG